MEITIKWNVDSKSDEEAKKKVMALLENNQGTMLPPLPDWDPEELRNEIQDLKLENDRLKQREDKMIRALRSICCDFTACDMCMFKEQSFTRFNCISSDGDIEIAKITLKELEEI